MGHIKIDNPYEDGTPKWWQDSECVVTSTREERGRGSGGDRSRSTVRSGGSTAAGSDGGREWQGRGSGPAADDVRKKGGWRQRTEMGMDDAKAIYVSVQEWRNNLDGIFSRSPEEMEVAMSAVVKCRDDHDFWNHHEPGFYDRAGEFPDDPVAYLEGCSTMNLVKVAMLARRNWWLCKLWVSLMGTRTANKSINVMAGLELDAVLELEPRMTEEEVRRLHVLDGQAASHSECPRLTLCRWMKDGGCRMGQDCKFVHV